MKKKESTLVNMVVVLFIITLVAGLTLGFVNDLTLAPKARARLAKKVGAIQRVLPPFDNDPVSGVIRVRADSGRDSIELYPAFMERAFIGGAATGTSEKGYSGPVRLMVGFQPDGRIINIEVLEQKETPGLGTKMKEDRFLRQFRDKNPSTFDLRPKKDGGQVDALAGATISTRAFAEAAQEAYDAFAEHKDTLAEPDN
jgi:electron transport complex protein RnfG